MSGVHQTIVGKDEAEQRAKMNILEQVGEIVSDILEAKQEVLW